MEARKQAFRKKKSSLMLVPIITAGAVYPAVGVAQEGGGGIKELEEIVVTATGTLLRGIAPTGTNVIGLTKESIEITGVSSSQDLLARIPQLDSFNTVTRPSTNIGSATNAPRIRGALDIGGGSTTLVLFNGQRLTGAGMLQTVPDPAIIPPAIIERVDVVPDGGSSIYGSDAVAGVINFISKREFDGVEIALKHGFVDGYHTSDVNVTGGIDWGSGNGLVSLYWTERDELSGGDRDFISGTSGPTDYRIGQCSPGNITVDGTVYSMQTLAPGSNRCDPTQNISAIPGQELKTIYGSFTQSLSEGISLNVTAFYSERDMTFHGQDFNIVTGVEGSGTIADANPFFTPIAGETEQTVDFSYAPVMGDALKSRSDFEQVNITPELTIDLPKQWQAKVTYTYDRSESTAITRGLNRNAQAAALAASTTDSALNPYDVSATNPAVIGAIFDWAAFLGTTEQELNQLRAVFDGPLMATDIGDVRLAVGAEYFDYTMDSEFGADTQLSNPFLPRGKGSREVNSVFGEIYIPVLGDASPIGAFGLSLSARYDDYSDVGSTTNPKIGFDWHPTENLRVRGNWGSSFQAPSLADLGNAPDTRAQVIPVSPFLAPGDAPFGPGVPNFLRPTILIAGGNQALEPEEAETWSLGFDWTPGFVENLEISLTYWNIQLEEAISIAPFFIPEVLFTNPALESFYIKFPTQAEAEAFVAEYLGSDPRFEGVSGIADLYTGPFTPYAIFNAQRNNLQTVELDGLDFNIGKSFIADLGVIDLGLAGTYTLGQDTASVPGAPLSDNTKDANFSRYNVSAHIGLERDQFSARLTANHKDGWHDGTLPSFTLTNLYLGYALPESGVLPGMQLSLNIDNLFDWEPDFYDNAWGYRTDWGFSVGRLVSLGLKMSF